MNELIGSRIPATSLAYRPASYFGDYDLQAHLLTHVKGRMRRAAIRDALESGELDQIPDYVKAAELTQDDRTRIGRVHPAFMGGEYLPRLKPHEVEIARISIRSTTYDVTTVYARPAGRRIAYRVADEYEGETLSGRTQRTSIRPLSMGQLIDFFLGAWNLFECLEANYEDDVDGMLSFFHAESEFYPYLDAELRERVEARFPRVCEEEDPE